MKNIIRMESKNKLLLISSIIAIIILSIMTYKENKFEQKADNPVNIAEKFFVYAMNRDFENAQYYYYDKLTNTNSMRNWHGPNILTKPQKINIIEIGPKYQSENEVIVQINFKIKDSYGKLFTHIAIFQLRKFNGDWKICDYTYRDWNSRNMVYGDTLKDYSLYPFINEDTINLDNVSEEKTDNKIVFEEVLEENVPQEIKDISLYGYWENQDDIIMSFDENNNFERSSGYITGGDYKVYDNNTIRIFHEGEEEWSYELDGDMLIINNIEKWYRKDVSADFNMYDLENDDFVDSEDDVKTIDKIVRNLSGKWNSVKNDGSLEFYTEMQCTFIGLNDSSIVGIMNRPYYYTIVDSDTIAFDSHPLYLDADFKIEDNELILYVNDNEYIYKKEITYDYDKIIGVYGQWVSSDGSIVNLDPFYGVRFEGIDIDNTFFYHSYNKLSSHDEVWEYEINNYDSYDTLTFYKNGNKETANKTDILEYQRKN